MFTLLNGRNRFSYCIGMDGFAQKKTSSIRAIYGQNLKEPPTLRLHACFLSIYPTRFLPFSFLLFKPCAMMGICSSL